MSCLKPEAGKLNGEENYLSLDMEEYGICQEEGLCPPDAWPCVGCGLARCFCACLGILGYIGWLTI